MKSTATAEEAAQWCAKRGYTLVMAYTKMREEFSSKTWQVSIGYCMEEDEDDYLTTQESATLEKALYLAIVALEEKETDPSYNDWKQDEYRNDAEERM